MNLREVIDASGKGYRDFARLVGCSHNHLFQVANSGKGLSVRLAMKIKEIDPRFSLEDQARVGQPRADGGSADGSEVAA